MPETPSDALPAPDPDARTETVRDRGAGRARRPHWIERLEPGSAVGRYVILERVGAGGMGVVYGAFDPDLDRKIALKFLRPELSEAEDQAQERLLREARVLARLEHPNVVAVYDVGTFQGNVFIAMAFGKGVTLRQWLGQERRDWRQVLAVFEQAGRGLAAAHAAGVVHRDFKPDNVMISGGVAQVLDFGLARKVSDLSPDADPAAKDLLDFTITRTGEVFGTPAYMAPEQHLGCPADARSDQFAFCVSLYEALYGEHPFLDRTPDESRRRVLTGEIKEPPADAEVPGWLRRALVRGLSNDPDRRHSEMDALLEALRADPSRSRRRWPAGAVAAALAGLGILAVFFLSRPSRDRLCTGGEARLAGAWNDAVRAAGRQAFVGTGERYAADSWRSVEGMLDRYAGAWQAMYRDACEATHVRGDQSAELLDLRMACLDRRFRELEALTRLLARADAAVVENAIEAVGALSDLDVCANATALMSRVRPPADPEAAAGVEAVAARMAELETLETAGRQEAWLEGARAAVGAADAVAYPPVQSEAWLARGRAEAAAGLRAEAEGSLHRALELAERGGDDLAVALAALELAWFEGHDQARPADGERWIRLAEAALARAGGNRKVEALIVNDLAVIHYVAGDYEKALAEASRALELRAAILGTDSYDYAETLNNLATIEKELGRYDDSIAHLEQVLAIRRPLVGPEHPITARNLSNLGVVYEARGDFDKALDLYRQVLAIYQNAAFPAPADVARAMSNIAVVLDRLGRHEEALAQGRQALKLRVENVGPDHVEVGISHLNVGATYRDLGRFEEALEEARQGLRIFEQTLGPEHPYVAYALNGVGMARTLMGQPELAVEPLERALELRRRAGNEPKNYAASCFSLAKALHAAGRDPGRAMDLAREARDVYAGLDGVPVGDDLAEIDAWLREREGR